jgi:hypothetical protein
VSETLDRLIGLALVSIEGATAGIERGGSLERWYRDMERIITTQQTAAYIAATAERLRVPPDSPLLSRSRLSRAEKQDIARSVENQLRYLRGFRQAIEAGELTPAQLAARANMYATGARTFYNEMRWGDWEIPRELLPGMQTCMGRCRCSVSVTDNGDGTGVLLRVMGGTENHCEECPPLAGEHPVRRKRAA